MHLCAFPIRALFALALASALPFPAGAAESVAAKTAPAISSVFAMPAMETMTLADIVRKVTAADIAATATLPGAAGETISKDPDGNESGYVGAAQDLINQGMNYLGIRYRFGGTSPETGLDCSGLVRNVFRNALGLDLPRTAREMSSMGDKVTRQDLKPGDLVFFNTMRRAFSHVGIYVGDGQFLHSATRGGGVRIGDLSDSYWSKRFNGARRLLDDEAQANSGGASALSK